MSISRFKSSSSIPLLPLLIFILLQLSASTLNQNGVAILNPPLISINGTRLNGTLYQIYQQICSSLNINATFETQSIKKLNESLPKLLANASNGIDFVLGYPVLPDDLTFDMTYQNVSKIELLQEEMYIFKPNLLQALVINVLREMFFVIIIIMLPWFLVNVSLFYLIEIRKFYKMDFFQGLYQSLRSILYIRTQMSKCAQVYSLVFYLLTAIIIMLLLGDFIYVIAAMLLRSSDVDNINDLVNTTSKACYVDGDYLILDFLSTREEIAKVWAPDVLTCFTKLSTFDAGSFLISEYKIKDYFMRHPKQNNIFDFILKDSVSLTYYLLVRTSSGLATPIQNVVNNLNQLYIPELEVLEFKDPVFNKISPSSIFSDSILLIFTSLTITSMFLIFFLVILICKQKRRSHTKHIRMRDRSDKKEKKERKDKKDSKHKSSRKHVEEKKYELTRQSDRNPVQRAVDNENPEYIERRHNGLTDQNVHQRQGHKPVQSQQNPSGRNNIRNTNNNHINNGGNNNHGSVNNNANNNKTLSLSGGPIQLKKFEGRPEKSWLKIDAQSSRAEGSFKFQGTSDFENQLSPVEKADDTVKSKHEFEFNGVDQEGNK